MNQKEKQIYFTLSGFGPFGSVKTNPTMEVISSISEDEKQNLNILVCDVLETSTIGCKQHMDKLKNLKFQGQCFGVNIHFGVYAGSSNFHLEQCGYNQEDFSIPDVRGYQGLSKHIDEQLQIDHRIETQINLDLLENKLREKGFQKLEQSSDPGRYICNYIYFNSLNGLQEFQTTASLFIHVPLFNVIPKAVQKEFMLATVKTLSEMYEQGTIFKPNIQKK